MQPWRNSPAAEVQQALCQHDRQLPDVITLVSSSTVYIWKPGIPSYQCCFHHYERAYLHLKAKDVRFTRPSDNASIGLFRHLDLNYILNHNLLPNSCGIGQGTEIRAFSFLFFFLEGGRRQETDDSLRLLVLKEKRISL